ncbi:hypothetical protein BSKO_02955 [Bryopsis sp. KO-2023]|nr:hypothetical protein BSKO_02955 [Bryopsis sp. KO-2023]
MVAQWPVIGGARSLGMNAGRASETSRAKAPPVTTLVAGPEVVGRKIQIREEYGQAWISGRLTEFNAETNEHRFVADASSEEDGSDDEDELENGGIEEWVCLGKRLFRWVAATPPDSEPNPTYKDFPGDHAAIGWKVRVYWNEMGRWYIGHVRSFDHRTGMHEVRFCDGDVRFYLMRNEPVLWLDRPQNRKRARKDGRADTSRKSSRPNSKANGVGRKSRSTTSMLDGDAVSDAGNSRECDSSSNDHGRRNGESQAPHASGSNAGKDSRHAGRDSCGLPSHKDRIGASPSQLDSAVVARSDKRGVKIDPNVDKGAANGVGKEEGDHDSSTWHLRPRKGMPFTGAFRNPRFSVVKARVGIFWEGDDRFYRGTISSYNEITGKYTIFYDDNTKEELDLRQEKFQWYGPRGRSGVYSSAMRDTMIELGFQGLPKQGSVPTPSPPSEEARSADPNTLIGKRIFVYWAANGQYYEGEVLAYCKRKKTHFVWYKDGEVEWLDVSKEHVIWGELARGCTFPAGLAEGEWQSRLKPTPQYKWGLADEDPPRGRAAMGWRVAVFWKDDATFYEGKVTGYNNATGRHDVLYDDNETENLSLSSEKVIWRLPPSKSGRRKGSVLKTRKSSQSERTEKDEDDTPSVQNQTPDTNPSAPSSVPPQRVKGTRGRGRGRGRRNGNRNVQSSSRPTSRRRRSIAEGDSEVVGPAHSPNEEETSQASPKIEIVEDEADNAGGGTVTPQSPEKDFSMDQAGAMENTQGIQDASGRGVGGLSPHLTKSPKRSMEEACEGVVMNGHIAMPPAGMAPISPHEREGNQEGVDGMEASDSGSPRSDGHMSVDGDFTQGGNMEAMEPDAYDNLSWDKLPSVDVTRLVRLPPEFGSLEVKLRITAGRRESGTASGNPAGGQAEGRQSDPEDLECQAVDRQDMLQSRVSAIDQMLSAIGRYERAHQTVGHVASRCDQVAMTEVLPVETFREAAGRAPIDPPSISALSGGTRKNSPFNFTTRDGSAARSKKTSGKRASVARQRSLPGSTSGASLSRINLAGPPSTLAIQSSASSPALKPPPPVGTLPSISQTSGSGLVAQISPRATSQFGVSSVPAIVPSYCKQSNPSSSYSLLGGRRVESDVGNDLLLERDLKDTEGLLIPPTSSLEMPLDVLGGSGGFFYCPSSGLGEELLRTGANECSNDLNDLEDLTDLDGELRKQVPGKGSTEQTLVNK